MQSVEEQDYPHIEHIVVDGHSQDDTLEIVQQYPHTATLISEKDEGIYDAMNKGIRAATGDVIGILNSDDIYANAQVISSGGRRFSGFEHTGLLRRPPVYGCTEHVDHHAHLESGYSPSIFILLGLDASASYFFCAENGL